VSEITIRFSTSLTPGEDQAESSAYSLYQIYLVVAALSSIYVIYLSIIETKIYFLSNNSLARYLLSEQEGGVKVAVYRR
jgi:hypothetical protein